MVLMLTFTSQLTAFTNLFGCETHDIASASESTHEFAFDACIAVIVNLNVWNINLLVRRSAAKNFSVGGLCVCAGGLTF